MRHLAGEVASYGKKDGWNNSSSYFWSNISDIGIVWEQYGTGGIGPGTGGNAEFKAS